MPPAQVDAQAAPLPARPLPIPTVSFGPFRLLEAVPWLMLASAMRFLAYGRPAAAIPALVIANLSLFLAFLLAARRVIEFADGQTALGRLEFREQLALARRVLYRVIVLLLAAVLAFSAVGAKELAPHMLMGFDGIAFDQFSKTGMVWSSVLAAIVLLMVVRAGLSQHFTLRDVLKEFWDRSPCLLPAIVAVAAFQFGLSFVQGAGRSAVFLFWQTSPSPQTLKNVIYFIFVFGFAALRLWVTLAILTFALRESYRRGEGTSANIVSP